MKNLIQGLALTLAMVAATSFSISAHADMTAGEHVQEAAEDAVKNTKQAGRAVKDKACEMVNGKLECAGKKAKHKMRNAKDEIKDKVDDVQKKLD